MRRSILIILLLSAPAFAQEFGRGTGGELSLLAKRPTQISGAFGFSFGHGSNAFDGSLGGTLVPDRLWFFASARRSNDRPLTALYGAPSTSTIPLIDGKATGQLGSSRTLTTSIFSNRALLTGQRTGFKTLNFTSVVSPNAFFTVNASQITTKP